MLLGLAVSGLTALSFARKADGADLARFEALCERLQGELVRRVEVHENGLKGTRGVFAASTSVERAEFTELVATRDIGREFPGCLGIGYIHRVRRSELAAYLERVRADGAPAFEIRNDAGGDELFVVQYIEPVPVGVEVLGLDIGFEQGRRAAAEAAMRTGEAVLTPAIGLLRGDRQGPGLLYMLAFYRRGASVETEAQRVEALEGWVYMPLLASGVFAQAGGVTDGELDFEVFDGAEPALSALLYDDDGHLREAGGTWEGATARERYAGRRLQRYGTISVGGRTWTVSMSTTPAFEPSSRLTVWLTGIGGALLSVLLGAFLHAQNAALGRSTMLAESMTRDMRRLALVAQRTTNAVIIADA
ncbi:MAG: CHASE domain-containing protein, partial [Phycisphaerales bacterium]|nr:CHASE domain-containing protein [Phycisphaerales bacterium]